MEKLQARAPVVPVAPAMPVPPLGASAATAATAVAAAVAAAMAARATAATGGSSCGGRVSQGPSRAGKQRAGGRRGRPVSNGDSSSAAAIRRMKNREAAQALRDRKKAEVEAIERRAREVEARHVELKQTVSSLENDNEGLRAQIAALRATATAAAAAGATADGEQPQAQQQGEAVVAAATAAMTEAVAASSRCGADRDVEAGVLGESDVAFAESAVLGGRDGASRRVSLQWVPTIVLRLTALLLLGNPAPTEPTSAAASSATSVPSPLLAQPLLSSGNSSSTFSRCRARLARRRTSATMARPKARLMAPTRLPPFSKSLTLTSSCRAKAATALTLPVPKLAWGQQLPRLPQRPRRQLESRQRCPSPRDFKLASKPSCAISPPTSSGQSALKATAPRPTTSAAA